MTYIQPGVPFLLIVLALAALVYRNSRRGKLATAVALALLFLWGWPPVEYLASGTLEWWYPVTRYPAGEAEAIVILSGGAEARNASQQEDIPSLDTYLRCLHGAWLYHHWRTLPIVVSGGPTRKNVELAEVMKKVLEGQGVPAAMIWKENRSQSTYENAVYTAGLLRSRGIHRIVLVTEAQHMLRSDRSFRRQGLVVTPAPCCYRTSRFQADWKQLLPDAKTILANENNIHEWVGLIWYRLTGKI